MNNKICLDDQEVNDESPILKSPKDGIKVKLLIGENELPDFHGQTNALLNVWKNLGCYIDYQVVPEKNHFDVLDCLLDEKEKLIVTLS